MGKNKKGGSVRCRKRQAPYSQDLNGPDGAQLAARFLSWYILKGHDGYKVGVGSTLKLCAASLF